MKIDFGPYRPDMPSIQGGVSSNIINAYPILSGGSVAYSPIPGISVLSGAEALEADPRGGATAVTTSNSYKAFIATASKIFEMDAVGAFTERGSGYAVPGADMWSAVQFGDKVVFSNTADGMLQYDVEAGGSITSVTNAPAARFIFTAFGVLFALDCDGNNRLMQNSDRVLTEWNKGLSSQQTFPSGQELIAGGAISNQAAIVLQRNAVRILNRVPNRSLYRTDVLAEGIGAVSPQSVVTVNGMMFFYDEDGFYMTNGGAPVPIGAEKVNRTFAAKLSTGEQTAIQGAADPTRQMIYWRYRANDVNSNTVYEDIIAYSWRLNEFVPVEVNTTFLITMASPGYNLDNIDSFGDADTAGLPLADDPFWKGGAPAIGALDGDRKFGFFNGANLAATLETNDVTSGQSMLFRAVTPKTDAANATVQVGTKDKQSGTSSYSTAASIEDSGRSMVRARGKIASLKMNIAAGESWSEAIGFDNIEVSAGGVR